MGYLGNNLQAAYSSYLLIDSLTASFNGTTTSFPLRVNGFTPVPFPANEQNVLISVGGVPQKPDPTGAEGFRFSGSNIVFSSAPKTGEAFWGVVLAGADYVNIGADFPDGTASVPSITFAGEKTTGFYRPASGSVAVTLNGVLEAAFTSGGLSIYGSSSGSTTVTASAAAGNNVLTLPANNGSAYQVLRNGATAGTIEFGGTIVSGTAQASTSGTSIDFTGIPGWVKRVTVMFNGVSTNGTSPPQIQLGTVDGIEITGYLGSSSFISTAVNTTNGTAGYLLGAANWASTVFAHGSIVISLQGSNAWIATGFVGNGAAGTTYTTSGSKTLSGTLDRVRITTVNGTDAFDAGTVNILYE